MATVEGGDQGDGGFVIPFSPYGLTWLLPFSGLTVTPLHRDLRVSVSLLVRTLKRQAQGSCGSKQHFALRLSKFNELKVIRLSIGLNDSGQLIAMSARNLKARQAYSSQLLRRPAVRPAGLKQRPSSLLGGTGNDALSALAPTSPSEAHSFLFLFVEPSRPTDAAATPLAPSPPATAAAAVDAAHLCMIT